MPIDNLMVSLVVVAEEIVIGSRRFVVGIVEAANLLCSFDNPQEYISTLNELRKDAQASLGGFIDEDVWGIRRAESDHADLVGFHLEDSLDRPLKGMFKCDHAVGIEAQRRYRLNIEGIGDIRGKELNEAIFLTYIVVRPRHGSSPVA